jgi:hypothetical protein
MKVVALTVELVLLVMLTQEDENNKKILLDSLFTTHCIILRYITLFLICPCA